MNKKHNDTSATPVVGALLVEYIWEGVDGKKYSRHPQRVAMGDFNEAVKLGVSKLALCFTLPNGENPGRHFTNVGEIQDAAAVINYLGGRDGIGWYRVNPPTPETLTRMFSRVSQNPSEQLAWSGLKDLNDVVSLLKKEPEDVYFLTPSNGGFVKLEKGDKAYDRQGNEVWPPKSKPMKGSVMKVTDY